MLVMSLVLKVDSRVLNILIIFSFLVGLIGCNGSLVIFLRNQIKNSHFLPIFLRHVKLTKFSILYKEIIFAEILELYSQVFWFTI